MNKGYDPKCYELAEYFLADRKSLNSEVERTSLAQHIQDAIELWFVGKEEGES